MGFEDNIPDSQTPPMSDLYKTRISADTGVSPLEVIGSMGKNIDDGIAGNLARGYLLEQAYSYFGKSGSSFSNKYFTKGHNTCAYDIGGFVGMAQDFLTIRGLVNSIDGRNDLTTETFAALFGLKIATQIGAYLLRNYQAAEAKTKAEKANQIQRPGAIDAELFESTGEVRALVRTQQGDKK